jgi:hypothetical protein
MTVSVAIYGSEDLALNRSEGKIETAKMCFLSHVSGYTMYHYKPYMQLDNMQFLTCVCFRRKTLGYKNKWHNHFLRMNSLRLARRILDITNWTNEEMLDDRRFDCSTN